MIASPFCAVDIYPFEGGAYSLLASQGNSQVLSCSTSHAVQADNGTFTITLSPGGPSGVDGPSWSQVITPMSLCVIAFQRADHSFVDMVGVVQSVQETQSWAPASSVSRMVTVQGCDFGCFFSRFNWATLAYVGGNTLAQGAQSIYGNPGFGAIMNYGIQASTPDLMAAIWYSKVMMSASGIMGETFVPYHGQQIGVSGAIAARIDTYPAYSIPAAMNFMSEDDTWSSKFRKILPFPVYEWFVGTGPSGIWGPTQSGVTQQSSGTNTTIALPSGYAFKSSLLPQAIPGLPQMIGRINPQPNLTIGQTSPSSPYQFSGVYMTNFNNLNLYQLEDGGFIQNTIQFGLNNVRNFYVLNPAMFNFALGGPKDGVSNLFLQYAMLSDPASIHRYGYYPYPFTSYWFNDNAFQQQVVTQGQFQNMIADVMSRVASYCEPNPLMAQGSVTMELRPDIFAGNTFQYSPFKAPEAWTFYIESVQHTYSFGGPSTTTLGLSRGLPASVYSDQVLLKNVLSGNAMRLNGQYVSGLPANIGKPLEAYTIAGAQEFLSDIAQIYVTPGMK